MKNLPTRLAFEPLKGGRWSAPGRAWLVVSVAAALACSTPAWAQSKPDASAAGGPAGAAGAAAQPAKPPADPAAPKPFAEVIKDAKVQDGFLPVWRKDDKVWLEIPADRLGKAMLMSFNIAQSVGERGLYGSQMGRAHLVEWRRVGNQMQLLARNRAFRPGDEAAPTARVVAQAFSDSLLSAAPVASAPHPERKSVLVDAGFLLSDLSGYSTNLEYAFRLPYAVDRPNSHIEQARVSEDQSSLTAKLHYAVPRIGAPPLTPLPVSVPPPQTTPDARSLFVTLVYNFAALPETPMATRPADPRLGHFTESFTEIGRDAKANARVHHVARWRLEKKDPTAALSEPVAPITFWLDRNIPLKYRAAVEAGVLEWNKAFERIGFKQAVVARQQPDDADFDTLDARHASIRWFVGADVGFAIGPSHRDPRSGEILDADIGMSDVFTRGARRFVADDVARMSRELSGEPSQRSMPVGGSGLHDPEHQACSYAAHAANEMAFAFDVLEARGDIAPDSPEADAYVNEVVKDVIMHEVGHTLGLKHNFKASTAVSAAQLRDKAYTEALGISASVMDYNANNIPLRGEVAASLTNTTLGPYDYWAIEYAYKPFAPAEEAAGLAAVAARSVEPQLIYADDADAGGMPGNDGIDPLANRFDLSADPLAYYRKRLALSQELWARVQSRQAKPGEDPLRARRSLLAGFTQVSRAAELVAKYVGGMHTLRDLPGTNARPNYRPVEPAKQREAMQFLAQGLFSVDSFRFRPEFLTALTPDYNEWDRGGPVSIPSIVARMQNQALDRLFSAGVAQRLIDLPAYLPATQRKGILTLNEVYASTQQAVWSELRQGQPIEAMRRTLQREHLKRVQALLLRGGAGMPADAISLIRLNAQELQTQLRAASARPWSSVETRAHVLESLGSLTEALKASMVRG
jgi:hypothetical protein